MEEFFEKIKKKLSVDNILDLMKDGKLKEEIKQTLTATMNLNERPRQEEVRAADVSKNITIDPKNQITVENIQHKTTEDQSKQLKDESKEKPDAEIGSKNYFNVLQKPNIQPEVENDKSKTPVTLNETHKMVEENEIQKKASGANLKPAIVELNETINMLEEKDKNNKTPEPNVTNSAVIEESGNALKLESIATGSIQGAPESEKSNLKIIQKPLALPSQTEQAEAKNKYDDFLNLT